MPKTCKIAKCKRSAKLRCTTDLTKYFCNTDDEEHCFAKQGLRFSKIVNCPCKDCLKDPAIVEADQVKEAKYGPVVDGRVKRVYCVSHCNKRNGEEDLDMRHDETGTKRKCEHAECRTEPTFALPGETKRRFCKKHKPEEAVRTLNASTCNHPGCFKQASYNDPTEVVGRYCFTHKNQSMVNVIELRLCACGIRATYALDSDGGRPTHCARHRTPAMVDVVNKPCVHNQNMYMCYTCSPCPLLECSLVECDYKTRSARDLKRHEKTHTKSFYRYCKNEEAIVADALNRVGIDFKREHTVSYRCMTDTASKFSRIDFIVERTDSNGTMGLIFVEVDEHQHKCSSDVTCDVTRMSKIMEAITIDGNTLPVKFIRYNPNEFTEDYIDVSDTISVDDRLGKLVNTIMNTVFDTPFAIEYLFYDTVDRRPVVLSDPRYFESMKRFVV